MSTVSNISTEAYIDIDVAAFTRVGDIDIDHCNANLVQVSGIVRLHTVLCAAAR